MKTVKKNNKIKRVSDKRATFLVGEGWSYCPKHEYKALKESDSKKTKKSK